MVFLTLCFLTFSMLVVFVLGVLSSLLYIRCFCETIYEFYVIHIAPRLGLSVDLRKKFGEWAIVTGATDGIGKGYVLALAAKGLNIILVSRDQTKLERVIGELKQQYPNVSSRYIVHDFSKAEGPTAVAKFETELRKLYPNIGILVNNVGTVQSGFAKKFCARLPHPLDGTDELIQTNINSMVLMTSVLLPEFVRKNKGTVINISSISAVHPTAGMAMYNGSKAFMDFFSRSIRQEMYGSNVFIQTVYPGFVKTKLIPERLKELPSCIAPDYKTFAKQCVETIGLLPETYGCSSHRLQSYLISCVKCLPLQLSDRITSKVADARSKVAEGSMSKKNN